MAPFANRIRQGRFNFAGRDINLPVNRPDEGMAIHGFSRDRAWSVLAQNKSSALLRDEFSNANNPYSYEITLSVTVTVRGISLMLSLRNTGSAPLPFGFGFHPWFRKTPLAKLTFAADGYFGRGADGLPLLPLRLGSEFNPGTQTVLSGMPWLDRCYSGWDQIAQISYPEDDITVSIRCDGELRLLHVYVPDRRDVICAEPVSHVPDAHNRPALYPFGGLQVLRSQCEMAGSMLLSASPLDPMIAV